MSYPTAERYITNDGSSNNNSYQQTYYDNNNTTQPEVQEMDQITTHSVSKSRKRRQQQQNSSPSKINSKNNNETHDNNIVTGEEIPYEKLQLMSKINFDPDVIHNFTAKNPICWICQQRSDPNAPMGTFFKPCACGPAHRSCWYKWHRSTMSPKTWWSCETCMHDYKYETLPGFDPDSAQEDEIVSTFQKQLFLFYFALFLLLAIILAFVTCISYFADNTHYNVPIGMKYVLTSVVDGVPSANTTQVWRENFENGETKWPFYLLLGTICTSVLIIVLFLCNVCYEKCCDDDDTGGEEYNEDWKYDSRGCKTPRHHKKHLNERSTCSRSCHCSHSGFFFCWVCTRSSSGGGGSSSCNSMCNPDCFDLCCAGCTCTCPNNLPCCSGAGGGSCGCENCGDKCNNVCGNCKLPEGKSGPVLAVVIIIIVIAILLSAIVIIIYVASTRFARFHAEVSEALYCRNAELKGKMLVLGEGESLRPTDEV